MDLCMAYVSVENSERWSLPSHGWLKINSNVAIFNGGSVLAFIVRENRNDVIEMASKLSGHRFAFEAELAALAWAAEYAAEKN